MTSNGLDSITLLWPPSKNDVNFSHSRTDTSDSVELKSVTRSFPQPKRLHNTLLHTLSLSRLLFWHPHRGASHSSKNSFQLLAISSLLSSTLLFSSTIGVNEEEVFEVRFHVSALHGNVAAGSAPPQQLKAHGVDSQHWEDKGQDAHLSSPPHGHPVLCVPTLKLFTRLRNKKVVNSLQQENCTHGHLANTRSVSPSLHLPVSSLCVSMSAFRTVKNRVAPKGA